MKKLNLSLKLLFTAIFCGIFSLVTMANTPTAKQNLRDILLNQGYVEIPLQITPRTNKLAINVFLDNDQPTLFLLDNGAPENTISSALIEKLGLNEEPDEICVSGAGNHNAYCHKVIIPKLTSGEFTTENVAAYSPQGPLPGESKLKYDGILGFNFMRSHGAILDIGNKKLYLKRNKNITPDQTIINNFLINMGYQPIDIMHGSGYQTITVQINNFSPEQFMLDTGSPITFISIETANQHRLPLSKAGMGEGATGGTLTIYKTRIKNLSAGSQTWLPKKDIYVMDYSNILAGDMPVHGTLGMDWLQENGAIIDMANNKLFTKKLQP